MKGLAGVTGFFSANIACSLAGKFVRHLKASINISVAIPDLQQAPSGRLLVNRPGMIPCPVAAVLVHVAEEAWGMGIANYHQALS